MKLLQGRWKIKILFYLFANPSIRTLELKRLLQGISQKVLTEQLRELAIDGLIERTETAARVRRVEYRVSDKGAALRPVLTAMRDFSRQFAGNEATAM